MISFNTNEIKSITLYNSDLKRSVLFGIIDENKSQTAWVELKASEKLELTCKTNGTFCLDMSQISTSEKKTPVEISVKPRHLYQMTTNANINPTNNTSKKRSIMEKIQTALMLFILFTTLGFLGYAKYILSISPDYSPRTVFF